MKFDYTYIAVGDFLVFEPLIIVSNLIMLVLSVAFFAKLIRAGSTYASRMGWFMLMLGVSGVFGAICHSTHYQLGVAWFESMLFLMNAFSLLAIFFCFWGTLLHAGLHRNVPGGWIWLAVVWVAALLVSSYAQGEFLLIKIHAGIALLYALFVHFRAWRRTGEEGSKRIVWGIGASFMSIVVHSAHISLHEWFNYKDLAHAFMIVALVLIYRGVWMNNAVHSDQGAKAMA